LVRVGLDGIEAEGEESWSDRFETIHFFWMDGVWVWG